MKCVMENLSKSVNCTYIDEWYTSKSESQRIHGPYTMVLHLHICFQLIILLSINCFVGYICKSLSYEMTLQSVSESLWVNVFLSVFLFFRKRSLLLCCFVLCFSYEKELLLQNAEHGCQMLLDGVGEDDLVLMYQCTICDVVKNDEDALRRHMISKHSGSTGSMGMYEGGRMLKAGEIKSEMGDF